MKLTSLLAPLVAAALTTVPLVGQEITSVTPAEGAIGTIITLEGTNLDTKKIKPVLVADGEIVKKTKLRAVKNGTTPTSMEVEVKAAVPGTFTIAFKVKKDLVGESTDTFSALRPEPLDVMPQTAAPNTEVDVRVDNLGTRRFSIFIAGKRAKVVDASDPDVDGITTLRVRVPKVPAGTWPLVARSPLGDGILKGAITVPNGDGTIPSKKINTKITLDSLKPFKPKITQIDIDPASFDVGALGGSKKKPRALAVTIPVLVEDVEEGDSFTEAPAQIVFTEEEVNFWQTSESGGWSIDVVAVNEEEIILSLCGTLELVNGEGPATIEVLGTIVSPVTEPPLPEGQCEPEASLVASMTGSLELDDHGAAAWVPALSKTAFAVGNFAPGDPGGALIEGVEWISTYDPNTQDIATLENLLGANTMESFALFLADGTTWGMGFDTTTFQPTVRVTITSKNDLPQASGSIRGSLTGTIEGTVQRPGEGGLIFQTISGSFCLPWGFGDGT